jgi:hypothetical protein
MVQQQQLESVLQQLESMQQQSKLHPHMLMGQLTPAVPHFAVALSPFQAHQAGVHLSSGNQNPIFAQQLNLSSACSPRGTMGNHRQPLLETPNGN